jgi:hypothetical protein
VAPVNNTEEVGCLGGEWAERALEPNRMRAQGTSEAHLCRPQRTLLGINGDHRAKERPGKAANNHNTKSCLWCLVERNSMAA